MSWPSEESTDAGRTETADRERAREPMSKSEVGVMELVDIESLRRYIQSAAARRPEKLEDYGKMRDS